MLEAALETFGKTSSLAFQKSVNNGCSSKFLLTFNFEARQKAFYVSQSQEYYKFPINCTKGLQK